MNEVKILPNGQEALKVECNLELTDEEIKQQIKEAILLYMAKMGEANEQ